MVKATVLAQEQFSRSIKLKESEQMSNQTAGPPDPRIAEIWRPGDKWASIGRPITGLGAVKARMNEEFLFFEKGTLRSDSQQIPLAAINDLDANQSMTQKARKVGTLRVHISRPNGQEETATLEDLPDWKDAVNLINQAARSARNYEHQIRNTQHVNYRGTMPQPMPPSAPAVREDSTNPRSASSEDVFAQIERLGELRDKGFIGPEEFESKKNELLARL